MAMRDFGGVYDFSTLNSDPEPSATAEQETSGATIPGGYVVDVTPENLENVIQTSMSLPVIAVFSAAESQHSQTLVTQLTALVNKQNGRIQLAVVDATAQPQVASAFGITAVPAAVAVLQGQPVPLFQGLPDEDSLATTITKLLEAAGQYGLTGILDGDADAVPPEPEVPPLHKEGLAALEAGDLEGAHAAYSAAIAKDPTDNEAVCALHQVELLQRVQEINAQGSELGAQSLLHAAETAPFTDIETHLVAADLELSFGHGEAAFARLLQVIRATSGEDRNRARTRLLDLFDVAGQHSELVQKTRRDLANALF